MELVGAGRTADVFAVDDDRVLKLDRPEWNGVSHFEGDVVRSAHAAGLPVPEVFESVIVDGRHGIVLERIRGKSLAERLADGADADEFAVRFIRLHKELSAITLPGVPSLVTRLGDEVNRSGLPAPRCDVLRAQLAELAAGQPVGVCHFDLHPGNIVVSHDRWVVLDWLTAANGPPAADLTRTLLLMANAADRATNAFVGALRRQLSDLDGFDDAAIRSWTPIVAAARLAEGFEGPYADWLRSIAGQFDS